MKNNIRSILLALAILLSGSLSACVQKQSRGTEETVMETSTIGTRDIVLYATGLGSLASQEVSFGFRNHGKVSEVLVSLGDKVEAGQVLARLESATLELKYRQAKANYEALFSPSGIAAAQQAVADARQSFATARDDLQFLIGPEMLVAEEAVAQAQQDLQVAKADANPQKIKAAEEALAKARETLDYAYYNYSSSYTRQTFTYPIRNDHGVTIRRDLIAPSDAELLAGQAAYGLAKANLEDAQNYLDVLLGEKALEEVPGSSVTPITEAKNALDAARTELAATELVAPIGGTVTSLDLSAGEEMRGSSVVTISNTDQPYTLDVYLDETDWDTAKVGYEAQVTFDLLPEETYTGKVIRVDPALDDSSDVPMIHILVQLDRSLPVDLPAGSTAGVDVTGGEALEAVAVPTTALKEAGAGRYIVYLMQNGKPVAQEVELGIQDILYAEVKSGLKVGDVVLTDAMAVEQ